MALSEYDQYLREDEKTNRMTESLDVFDGKASDFEFHTIKL